MNFYKYRILESTGTFYPQYRFILWPFWSYFKGFVRKAGNGFRKTNKMYYYTLEEARNGIWRDKNPFKKRPRVFKVHPV